MSTYEKYINETIENEYDIFSVLKKDDTSVIQVYKHKSTDNKLVKIVSKNRNDHIYRKLRDTRNDNLPCIFDICSSDEHLVVLEEFIEGTPLSEISDGEKLSVKTILKYALDVCCGLEVLHDLQIIHRDIKPSNIIITPERHAVLIDFSASRLINDTQDKDTTNLGTIGYAAPEQYGVTQSTAPTDIYALGVMVNELVLNVHPSIKTPKGKLGKIIKKCTNTQISNRYQTVKELIKDLKRCQKFCR